MSKRWRMTLVGENEARAAVLGLAPYRAKLLAVVYFAPTGLTGLGRRLVRRGD